MSNPLKTPGTDFDTDLANVNFVREKWTSKTIYATEGQKDIGILLSFIDNLWKEYSRVSNAATASEKHLAVANKLWRLCVDEGWPWAAGEVQDALEEMGLLYPKDMTTEDCGEQCENCSGDCDRCFRAVKSLEDVK